jgi:putative sigma-54 modulation protein
METNVTFRHFEGQHPHLQELALESLQKLERFHDNIISGDVIFSNQIPKTVEMKIYIKDKSLIINEENEELKKALHDATDRMIRQIKKHKTKINQ